MEKHELIGFALIVISEILPLLPLKHKGILHAILNIIKKSKNEKI